MVIKYNSDVEKKSWVEMSIERKYQVSFILIKKYACSKEKFKKSYIYIGEN